VVNVTDWFVVLVRHVPGTKGDWCVHTNTESWQEWVIIQLKHITLILNRTVFPLTIANCTVTTLFWTNQINGFYAGSLPTFLLMSMFFVLSCSMQWDDSKSKQASGTSDTLNETQGTSLLTKTVQKNWKKRKNFCEISGSHGTSMKTNSVLWYSTV
jgi:hypothetical protein